MIFRLTTFMVLGTIGAVLGTWASDRTPPGQVVEVQLPKHPTPPGGQLRITYVVQRYRSCEMHIDRIMWDSTGARFPLVDLDFGSAPGPLGQSKYAFFLNIPATFAQGDGHYQAITAYICNPLQRIWPIIVKGEPVTFKVAGDPVPAAPVAVIPR